MVKKPQQVKVLAERILQKKANDLSALESLKKSQ